jgi:hypothetical protein
MKILGAYVSPTALAIGAGAVLLAPIILPFVAGILRPLAKAAIKGGLIAYEKAKVLSTEAVESLEDLAAEAKAEVAQQLEAEAEAEVAKPKRKPAAAKEATA